MEGINRKADGEKRPATKIELFSFFNGPSTNKPI